MIAEEWELLLRDKKNQAKFLQKSFEDKNKLIDQLLMTISNLERDLTTKITECNKMLDEKTVIQQ